MKALTLAEIEAESARLGNLSSRTKRVNELKAMLDHSECSASALMDRLQPFLGSLQLEELMRTLAMQVLSIEVTKLMNEGVDISMNLNFPGIQFTGLSLKQRETTPGGTRGWILVDPNSMGALGWALQLMKQKTGEFRLHDDGKLELVLVDPPRVTINCGASLKFGAEDTHWNPPGSPLPPVGSNLMIKIPAGTKLMGFRDTPEDVILKVQRTAHLQDRDGIMEYRTPEGLLLKGKFEWTHA